MKIDLAVYTAQEGYSWQPGTVFAPEELAEFKKRIGKFPSPDASDFPFGGVFLLDDRVVFYRYHVAKKIDFCGRDALYCVLGAVSRAEAAKIAPAALFASSEFAGPMKPFPTVLELPEAESSAVPEWLKNLDRNTLDVRITGSAEKPNYAVVQKPIEVPKPPIDTKETTPAGDPGAVTPAGGADGDAPKPDSSADEHPVQPAEPVPPVPPSKVKPKKKLPWWILVGVAVVALLIVGLSSWAVWFCWKRYVASQESPTRTDPPGQEAPGAPAKPTEAPAKPTETNAPKPAMETPVPATNVPETVTKAPVAPTNGSESVTKKLVAVVTNNVPAANAPEKKPEPSAKSTQMAPRSPQTSNTKRRIKPASAQKKQSGKGSGKTGR